MQSLLQDEVLPFSDALTVDQIQQAFAAEGVSFGGENGDTDNASVRDGGIVYTRGVTLWAMLSQALLTDLQRSCLSAVQRVAVYYALTGSKDLFDELKRRDSGFRSCVPSH